MIKICGNCKYYVFRNDPSEYGSCNKMSYSTHGPLRDACENFCEKRR